VRRILPSPIIALSLALLLTACGEANNPDAAPPGSEPQPEPPPGPVGPPVTTPPTLSFVGSWATTAANCRQFAWTVEAEALDTPGEVSCRWKAADVSQDGPARWTAPATCSGEAEAAPTRLTFIGGEENLTIEGAPFRPTPLVRCSGAEG